MPLRVVCAWCLEEITPGDEPTSHGICERCAAEQFPDAPTLAEEDTPMTVKELVSRLLNFDMDATVVLSCNVDVMTKVLRPGRSHIYTVQLDESNSGVVAIVESSRFLTETEVVNAARSLDSDLREDR